MFSLNNYVPEVAVISMNDDRLKKLNSGFQAIHTTYKVFPGIRATREDVQRFGNGCRVLCPADSAIGVLMAHRQVWEYMLQKGMPSIAVFEDDVRFTDTFPDVFPKAFAELPDDWDLLYMGCQTCHKHTWLDTVYNVGIGYTEEKPYSPHLVIPPIMLGTEAYIISHSGARKLLELTKSNGFHVDFLISKYKNGLNYYSITPQIAYQTAEEMSSSANTTPSPYLLNKLVAFDLNPHYPYDTRKMDWVLTTNLYKLVPLGVHITGWWLVFALLAFVSSYVFYALVVYILVESVFFPDRWLAYFGLFIAAVGGFGLRKLVGAMIK
jgi:GR25 family glycosyltransferase involved in LPS biosynthesis